MGPPDPTERQRAIGLTRRRRRAGPDLRSPRRVAPSGYTAASPPESPIHVRPRPHQRARERDQPVPAAARGQPRRLAAVGSGSARPRAPRGQADPALHRLLRLPLVPRHGARIVRGRGHRAADERAVRQHQGRPRGTARHRQDLPDRPPAPRPPHRGVAADGDADPRRPRALLRWHLLPGFTPPRHAVVPPGAFRGGTALPRAARRYPQARTPLSSRRWRAWTLVPALAPRPATRRRAGWRSTRRARR